ncbi:hypothetical protein [Paenibacillus thiaminolyticus]
MTRFYVVKGEGSPMNLANRITLARIGLIPLFLLFYQTYPV